MTGTLAARTSGSNSVSTRSIGVLLFQVQQANSDGILYTGGTLCAQLAVRTHGASRTAFSESGLSPGRWTVIGHLWIQHLPRISPQQWPDLQNVGTGANCGTHTKELPRPAITGHAALPYRQYHPATGTLLSWLCFTVANCTLPWDSTLPSNLCSVTGGCQSRQRD